MIAGGHLGPPITAGSVGTITADSPGDSDRCAAENGIDLSMYAIQNWTGRPLEDFIARVDSTSAGVAQLPDQILAGLGDLAAHAAILLGAVVLILLGAWVLFRD